MIVLLVQISCFGLKPLIITFIFFFRTLFDLFILYFYYFFLFFISFVTFVHALLLFPNQTNSISAPFLQLFYFCWVNSCPDKPITFYFYIRHRITCIFSNNRCNLIFFTLQIQLSRFIPLFK